MSFGDRLESSRSLLGHGTDGGVQTISPGSQNPFDEERDLSIILLRRFKATRGIVQWFEVSSAILYNFVSKTCS